MLMAAVAFFFLPDSPDKARFLNEDERLVARQRGVRQVGDAKRVGGIVLKDIRAALLDVKCWVTAVRLNPLYQFGGESAYTINPNVECYCIHGYRLLVC